jgi:RHS repeat-associated protein
LYSGEQFDAKIGQQYLRQRYYDPSTGRFNRLDPFFGNLNDPLSLHKYLYTHGDPVNGIDPSGLMFGVGNVMGPLSIGMRVSVGISSTAFRTLATFSNNITLNLYVRGTVFLAHIASKYPTMTTIASGGAVILDLYSTATSPDPALAFMMGPGDDIYNMTRSLGALLKSGQNGLKSLFITGRTASGQVKPLGVFAIVDRSTLRTGSTPQNDIIPAGFYDLPDITDNNQRARAHLLGKVLGGKGTRENLVTFYQSANIRMRNSVEVPILNSLGGSNAKYDEVYYSANPVHDGVTDYPRAIEIYAFGVKEGVIETTPFIAITILNQK